MESIGDYEQLEDKYDFEIVAFYDAKLAAIVLKDQSVNSKSLKWVHSFNAGLDVVCSV